MPPFTTVDTTEPLAIYEQHQVSIEQKQPQQKVAAEEVDPRFELFIKIGGDPVIRSFVRRSIDCMKQDIYLEYFLRGVDTVSLQLQMESIVRLMIMSSSETIDKLVSYLESVMLIHQQRLFYLGLEERHFDLALQHLIFAMQDQSLDRHCIMKVATLLSHVRQIFETGSAEARSRQSFACQSLRL